MKLPHRDADRDRKVNALIELANYAWKDFDGRRAQEWKANFSLWAALAAVAGLSTWQTIDVRPWFAICFWAFLVAIFIVYWLLWTTGMWRRNFSDTEKAKNALASIREMIDEKEPPEPPELEKKRRKFDPKFDRFDYFRVWENWSRGAQLCFTALFILIAAIAVFNRVSWTSSAYVTQFPG
jgi:hypothetical protein